MSLVTVVLTVGWLLASGTPRASVVAFVQTGPAQQVSPPDTPASPAKPCPASSSSQTAPQPDCVPVASGKKRRKKVVRDGGTTDPTVAISPGVNPQQASQQVGSTKWLLTKTDENLKIVTSRQLTAAQQETVHQIQSYVKQSKEASDGGDVQRAYALANKARMLSGDLVKH